MFRPLILLCALCLCSACAVPQTSSTGNSEGEALRLDELDRSTGALSEAGVIEIDPDTTTDNETDTTELDLEFGDILGEGLDGNPFNPAPAENSACEGTSDCANTSPLPAPDERARTLEINPGLGSVGVLAQ